LVERRCAAATLRNSAALPQKLGDLRNELPCATSDGLASHSHQPQSPAAKPLLFRKDCMMKVALINFLIRLPLRAAAF
jgi:hypothetical protein